MQRLKEKFFGFNLVVQAIILVCAMVVTFGLIAPSMVSSNSTIAVWVGVIIAIVVGYVCWVLSAALRDKLLS